MFRHRELSPESAAIRATNHFSGLLRCARNDTGTLDCRVARGLTPRNDGSNGSTTIVHENQNLPNGEVFVFSCVTRLERNTIVWRSARQSTTTGWRLITVEYPVIDVFEESLKRIRGST